MVAEADVPVAERIVQVLQHLRIEQAHIASRVAGDWHGLLTAHPERMASLTLVYPQGLDPAPLKALASRLLVITGDQGRSTDNIRRVLSSLPEARLVTMQGYVNPTPYTDVAVERTEALGSAMMDFMEQLDQRYGTQRVAISAGEGQVAGITYRVQGEGPALVLLPLSVAPSQWEPLVPRLSQRYCTVIMSGAALGMVASLEARGHTSGYLRVVGNLMDEVRLQPGDVALEVGCGTGVLDRWLARRTGGANRIVGVDINRFLLQEATALARQEGLEHLIEFREGSAEALPFPDHSFTVTMSSTVIQRADADRMLAEMVRVTKPGGRVGVVGHAHDLHRWVNLPLRAELKAKVEAPGWENEGIHATGCDEASLYRRMHQAGLTSIKMFPQFAAFDEPSRLQQLQANIVPTLSPAEVEEWRAAVAQAEAEGTFFIATPLHCAVGTKP
jgi:ubiquinone/menaquinone biosynthesis C-methylase UbiE